jgi:hypothetical protein
MVLRAWVMWCWWGQLVGRWRVVVRDPVVIRPGMVNRPGFRALSVMCDRSVDRHGFSHGNRSRVRRVACGRIDA